MKAGISLAVPMGMRRKKMEYPVWGMLAVMGLLYLAPFVSMWLAVPAFGICVFRIVRYDARVFAVDYAMLIPVTPLLRLPGGLSLLVFVALLGALWFFVREGAKGEPSFILFVLLLCYMLTRMQMAISNYILCIGQLFVMFVLLPKQNEWSAEQAAKAFCISVLISSMYAFVLRDTSYIYALRGAEVPAYWGSSVRRFQGLFEDTNYYMTLLIMGLAVLVKLRYCGRIRLLSFVGGGLSMTAFGIITYSKSFVIVYLLLAAVSIVWLYGENAPVRVVVLGSAAVMAVGFLLFAGFSPLSVVMTRLTSATNISDFTTGRSDVFVNYFGVIVSSMKNLFIGVGMGGDILAKAPHNLFLEIAYYTGIIGLSLFLCFAVALGRGMRRGREEIFARNRVATWLVLMMAAVLYCALHGMFSVISYGAFFMAYLSTLLVKEGGTAIE